MLNQTESVFLVEVNSLGLSVYFPLIGTEEGLHPFIKMNIRIAIGADLLILLMIKRSGAHDGQ